ncbi:hypothetical protein FA95DRAFT_1581211 [Auriscalpium vulgare]|uniref:Uncharacterized protein n=1 Tax=Auriscalpium vulgare TaxID=40419 RepID=A0ACB8S2B9_9AGAM|nr:hypothetical protein FA95DRAFT_1581211 [Auriscalpium vulgare]
MAAQTRPEPMNASPHHPKVKATLTLSTPFYIAGGAITGKLQLEARADRGLGIGLIMVELVAIEELTSRDHSATSRFLHTRRLYQGPGLPPSNAVHPHPIAGDPLLPTNYYPARRGITTFLFRLPIPAHSPSAIDFGSGLAKIKYEVRATVGVSWKGENRLVTDKKEVDVVENYAEDFDRIEPEGVIVGEHGKIWVQAKVVGGLLVAGEGACVELQVKNHSSKKSTGLSIALTRHLHLPSVSSSHKPPLQISDTLTSVNFRGPEYVASPGMEGLAQLVFDVPPNARTISAGVRHGDEDAVQPKEALFGVRCMVGIKMSMPIGSKDIHLDLPVTIFHPATLPPPPAHPLPLPTGPYNLHHEIPMSPHVMASTSPAPYMDPSQVHLYPVASPPPQTYGQNWYPQASHTPLALPYMSSPPPDQYYYYPQHHVIAPHFAIPRPSSAEPVYSQPLYNHPGLPPSAAQHPLLPLHSAPAIVLPPAEAEEGKGERASRITQHLRMTSRTRSVSPQSHRYPMGTVHDLRPPEPAELRNVAPEADVHLHSPRPMPSPTLTQTRDPFTYMATAKSERVEQLERMAVEVLEHDQNLSGELEIDKTLPAPPVPSGKDNAAVNRRRLDSLFPPAESLATGPGYSGPAPKTPTLSAVSLLKPPAGALRPSSVAESGLDALERRLLAEVGTRKLDEDRGRPDVRAVLPMPITIPRANAEDHDAINDSAISSLSLNQEMQQAQDAATARQTAAADVDPGDAAGVHDGRDLDGDPDSEFVDRISDERTQKQGRSHSGDSAHGTRKGKSRSNMSTGKSKSKGKKNKHKDKDVRDEEAVRLRKAAKGRVAEWLGRIEPTVPPATPSPVDSPRAASPASGLPVTGSPDVSQAPAAVGVVDTAMQDPSQEAEASAPVASISPAKGEQRAESPPPASVDIVTPNPRSSGFIPLATLRLRQDAPSKVEQTVASASGSGAVAANLSPRARFEAALKAAPPPALRREVPEPKKLVAAGQLRFAREAQLQVDSPAKYDVRSARGGRGGKVTSITALWANDSPKVPAPDKAGNFKDTAPASKPKPLASVPKVKATAGPLSTPSPLGAAKATSSPAALSSSLATPMLSSTASLSRPTTAPKAVVQRLPVVTEAPPASTPAPPAPTLMKGLAADFAFGQARLRDLIRKYQGQAA